MCEYRYELCIVRKLKPLLIEGDLEVDSVIGHSLDELPNQFNVSRVLIKSWPVSKWFRRASTDIDERPIRSVHRLKKITEIGWETHVNGCLILPDLFFGEPGVPMRVRLKLETPEFIPDLSKVPGVF